MKETWKNAAALMMSYLILLFLPQNINIFAYVILGLSAFLFMVGYFRLTEIFTAVYKKIGYLKARCLEMAVGLGIVTVGGILLYRTHGSGKAMVISFLFAMESIAILGTTGNDELHLKLERILSVIVCLYAVGMVIFAVLVLIQEKLDGVEIATLLLFECVIVWLIGMTGNYRIRIKGMKTPVKELCLLFEKEKTELGYPRLGKVDRWQECIIYGPDEKGVFVYGYYHFGRFYVALGDEERQTITVEDAWSLDWYGNMFEQFVTEGCVKWSTSE